MAPDEHVHVTSLPSGRQRVTGTQVVEPDPTRDYRSGPINQRHAAHGWAGCARVSVEELQAQVLQFHEHLIVERLLCHER